MRVQMTLMVLSGGPTLTLALIYSDTGRPLAMVRWGSWCGERYGPAFIAGQVGGRAEWRSGVLHLDLLAAVSVVACPELPRWVRVDVAKWLVTGGWLRR